MSKKKKKSKVVQLPMKWYKYLTRFGLPCRIILNISQFFVDQSTVTSAVPASLSLAMSIVYIPLLLAAEVLLVKKKGWGVRLYLAYCEITVLYWFVNLYFEVQGGASVVPMLVASAIPILALCLNFIYFKKRRELFS